MKLSSEIIKANNVIGQSWAQAYSGKKVIGLSPALIALFAQLAASLLPILLEKCGYSGSSLVIKAEGTMSDREAKMVKRLMRKKLGFVKYHWYGGERLLQSGIKALRSDESCKMSMRAYG